MILDDPARYDAWYATPRGARIGEAEFRLLLALLAPKAGETLLDIGCGTGYFTRRFRDDGLWAVGLDVDPAYLAYARAKSPGAPAYVAGDATRLPFRDGAFDCTVSVAAICFVADARRAVAEMVRVTRRRFVLGLLNRRSLLYWQKGRHGGKGGYRGARWDTADEALAWFAGLPVAGLAVESAVFVPGSGFLDGAAARLPLRRLPWGAILAVAGNRLEEACTTR